MLRHASATLTQDRDVGASHASSTIWPRALRPTATECARCADDAYDADLMDLDQRVKRLEEAVVNLSVLVLPSMPTGYVGAPATEAAHRGLAEAVAAIRAESAQDAGA
jgi:hypothetical protein